MLELLGSVLGLVGLYDSWLRELEGGASNVRSLAALQGCAFLPAEQGFHVPPWANLLVAAPSFALGLRMGVLTSWVCPERSSSTELRGDRTETIAKQARRKNNANRCKKDMIFVFG